MNLSNIEIVLVEPIYPGNVGSVARSAFNFGVKTIRIVGDVDVGDEEAKKMALYAYPLLKQAVRYQTLQEAVQTNTLVVGAVHQTRFNRTNPKPLWDLSAHLDENLPYEKIALVFGREDNGLTREEIDQCHLLSVIPTPEKLSFNIAHSVTIFLYEISRARSGSRPAHRPVRATHAEYTRLMEQLVRLLDMVQFFKGSSRDGAITTIRDILFRADFSKSDIPMIRAMIYKITNSYQRHIKNNG